jgi:hypothetical protein
MIYQFFRRAENGLPRDNDATDATFARKKQLRPLNQLRGGHRTESHEKKMEFSRPQLVKDCLLLEQKTRRLN